MPLSAGLELSALFSSFLPYVITFTAVPDAIPSKPEGIVGEAATVMPSGSSAI
jgi:hypothetical protein